MIKMTVAMMMMMMMMIMMMIMIVIMIIIMMIMMIMTMIMIMVINEHGSNDHMIIMMMVMRMMMIMMIMMQFWLKPFWLKVIFQSQVLALVGSRFLESHGAGHISHIGGTAKADISSVHLATSSSCEGCCIPSVEVGRHSTGGSPR